MSDLINRQEIIDALDHVIKNGAKNKYFDEHFITAEAMKEYILAMPSAQPEQRYTEEELRVFAHGISLNLLSKRSAQHWRYDKDRATEIEFLERLYDKVSADMRGEQDEVN